MALEEGDGRCVRASWPYSIKHSILNLLLNPPLVFRFHKNFRLSLSSVLIIENVAHFFPIHRLHLDLTFLRAIVVLTFIPFLGFAEDGGI